MGSAFYSAAGGGFRLGGPGLQKLKALAYLIGREDAFNASESMQGDAESFGKSSLADLLSF